MITFNDISYSLAELKHASTIYIVENFSEDWQLNFWQFIKDWFDDSQEYISVKTSGSTGKPKTIKHAKKYMIASAQTTNAFFKLDNTKTALLCLPTNTIGGMMMIVRALVSEANLIVQKPSAIPLEFIDQKIDFVAMVPLQVQQVFSTDKLLWNKVDTLIIGGGEIAESLRAEILKMNLNAYATFGMTETISHIALNKICDGKKFKVLNGVSFSLGKKNNLIINAPHLGISNLETKDVVRMESKHEFVWLGRLDHAIESGGFKIHPELVEQKISKQISSAFIISSLKDKKLNNKIILIIEGEKLSEISLKKALELLTKYEKPKEIYYLDALEYLANGKIDRIKTQTLVEEKFNIFKNT